MLFDGDFDLSYYYQQNINGGFSFISRAEQLVRKMKERKRLRLIGGVAGACIVLYVFLQNILSVPVSMEPFYSVYFKSAEFRSLVSIILSVLGLLMPFALGGYILHKKKVLKTLCFGRPNSFPLMFSAVPFGVLICLAGNYITSIFVALSKSSGVMLTAPEYLTPESLGGRILYAVSVAVVPALVEEFAIRGVVMQPLRRYGDRFAIVVSSIVFGILHGNLVQAPFAFIAGIGLGYAVCITNSVWTGVLIHFCNNMYSVAVDFLVADVTDEAMLNAVWNISQVMLYAVCIIGSVLFAIVRGRRKIESAETKLDAGSRWGAYFINPPMLVAILIMLYITAQYVHLI